MRYTNWLRAAPAVSRDESREYQAGATQVTQIMAHAHEALGDTRQVSAWGGDTCWRRRQRPSYEGGIRLSRLLLRIGMVIGVDTFASGGLDFIVADAIASLRPRSRIATIAR